MNINGTVFTEPLLVYSVNYTLSLKALLGGQDYFVVVQASTPFAFNNATNTTSNAIRVRAQSPVHQPMHTSVEKALPKERNVTRGEDSGLGPLLCQRRRAMSELHPVQLTLQGTFRELVVRAI